MTHEKLLGYTSAQLKAMTDAELLKLYEPVLRVTRPELAEKPQAATAKTGQSSLFKAKQAETIALMKQLGMDLPL